MGRPAEEESQRTSTAVEGGHDGTHLHSVGAQTLKQSRVSGAYTESSPRRTGQEPPDLLVPACLSDPQRDSPKFITLLAPLSTGSSHVSQTGSGVRKSVHINTDLIGAREQGHVHWPKPDGIHVQPSLGGEALTHIKDTAKNAPPEGRLHLDIAQGSFTERQTAVDVHILSRELSSLAAVPGDRFVISEEKRLAVFTLDIDVPSVSSPLPGVPSVKPEKRGKADAMPHKTHKSTTESKARPKKDKLVGHQGGPQTPKKEEQPSQQQACRQQEGQKGLSKSALPRSEDKEAKPAMESTEKASNKPHGKKKKKHAQHAQHAQQAAGTRASGESLADVENGAKPKTTKGRVDMFEAKLSFRAGNAHKDGDRSCHPEKKSIKPEAKISKDHPPHHTGHKDHQPKGFSSPLNDEIKRRRLSGDKFGKTVGVPEPKLPKPAPPPQEKREETEAPPKASSQVVNQKPASQEGKRHIQPSAGRPPGRRSLTSL